MAAPPRSVWVAVGLVLGVTLLSGPLVPQIDFVSDAPASTSEFCEPDGDASVTVGTVPAESFILEQRRFGVEKYYLTGSDTIASIGDVSGCPVLVYRFTIPDLNYVGQQLYFLSDSEGQTVSMTTGEGTFDPGEIEQQSYDATLTITLRGDERRTIYRENVTIGTEG